MLVPSSGCRSLIQMILTQFVSCCRSYVIAFALLTGSLMVGCGKPVATDVVEFTDLHPATGRVTFQGTPIVGGSVRIFPISGASSGAQGDVYTAVVAEDGSFELQTFRSAGRGIGVPAGEYGTCFSWAGHPDEHADLSNDELPEKLPARLTRPQTSGIRITVAAGGTVIPDIELK